jgi:hypothetical protein
MLNSTKVSNNTKEREFLWKESKVLFCFVAMINNNATVSINLEQITKSLENLLKEIVSNTFHFCSQTGITLQHCQELLEPEDEDFFHSVLYDFFVLNMFDEVNQIFVG